jgi:hypothetical protein
MQIIESKGIYYSKVTSPCTPHHFEPSKSTLFIIWSILMPNDYLNN